MKFMVGIFGIFACWGFYKCVSACLFSIREIKKIEANMIAPLNSNFSELISGL